MKEITGRQMSKAWRRWLKRRSMLCDTTNIGAPSKRNQFIENRLWVAFMAGIVSAERMMK